MAHEILGIDIGTYGVRVIQLETAFNHVVIKGFFEKPIRPASLSNLNGGRDGEQGLVEIAESEKTFDDFVSKTILDLIRENRLNPESAVCEIPGEYISTRVLEFVTGKSKKINLLVGGELQNPGLIPFTLAEIIYDYQVLKEEGNKSTVLTCFVKKDLLRRFLNIVHGANLELRTLGFNTISLSNLFFYLLKGEVSPVALIDIGHQTTKICIMNMGRMEFARTIMRAGKNITQAIEKHYHLDSSVAELLKHNGYLVQKGDRVSGDTLPNLVLPPTSLSAGQPGGDISPPPICPNLFQEYQVKEADLAGVIMRAVDPLVKEIRQTFFSYSNLCKNTVQKIYIFGGTAKLQGLDTYINETLQIPVYPLSIFHMPGYKFLRDKQMEPIMGAALAAALKQAIPQKHNLINFRRDDFAFKGNFQFLKEKSKSFVIAFVLLLIAIFFNLFFSYKSLTIENKKLDAMIQVFSKQAFKKEMNSFAAVETKLKGEKKDEENFIPSINAYDVLYNLHNTIGKDISVRIDQVEIDLDRERFQIRGVAEDSATIERMIGILESYPYVGAGGVKKEKDDKYYQGGREFVLNVTLTNI